MIEIILQSLVVTTFLYILHAIFYRVWKWMFTGVAEQVKDIPELRVKEDEIEYASNRCAFVCVMIIAIISILIVIF